MSAMNSVYLRMAELHYKQKTIGLTAEEKVDLDRCLEWHLLLTIRLTKLENLNVAAIIAGDTDWQDEIVSDIRRVRNRIIK